MIFDSFFYKYRLRHLTECAVAGDLSFLARGVVVPGVIMGISGRSVLFRTQSAFIMRAERQLVKVEAQHLRVEGVIRLTTPRGYLITIDEVPQTQLDRFLAKDDAAF